MSGYLFFLLSKHLLYYLCVSSELRGQPSLLTVINVSNRTQQVDVSDFIDLPNRLTLLVVGVCSQHRVSERLKPAEVKLSPHEGLVIQLKARK